MITLENVSKIYRLKNQTVQAVQDVSLSIREGEIYGIIGFSGAGKSTLVRCTDLLTLSAPELRQVRRKIGMIFQQFNLLSSRTVFENVALPLEGIEKDKAKAAARVRELLEYVELGDCAAAYPAQLSGGQKQRIAIARALANRPKALLCDEATSALDPQTTKSILQLLLKLNCELGITIVVITHEMAVIKKICNRVAVMENGRIVEEGEVFSVFANPQQPITRDFISTTSNLSEIYNLAAENSPVASVKLGELLLKIKYVDATVSEPLISLLARQFGVMFNILFSDVEIIGGRPLGGTVGVMSGKAEDLTAALRFLEDKNINLEVISDGGAA